MPKGDGLASALLVLAGLFATAWTVAIVWKALTWTPSGGGIGAVSSGLFLNLALIAALLLINLSIVRAARRHGPLAERFRRAHFWVLAVYAGWAVISGLVFMPAYTTGAYTISTALRVLSVVDAPFFPLQLFFALSCLAFAIGNPRDNDTRCGSVMFISPAASLPLQPTSGARVGHIGDFRYEPGANVQNMAGRYFVPGVGPIRNLLIRQCDGGQTRSPGWRLWDGSRKT